MLFVHHVCSIKCFSAAHPYPDGHGGCVRHRAWREEDRLPDYLGARRIDFHKGTFKAVVLFFSPLLWF